MQSDLQRWAQENNVIALADLSCREERVAARCANSVGPTARKVVAHHEIRRCGASVSDVDGGIPGVPVCASHERRVHRLIVSGAAPADRFAAQAAAISSKPSQPPISPVDVSR